MAHCAYVVNGEDGERRLCEVTNFYDMDGDETDDLELTISAVIKWDETSWISSVPDCPMSEFLQRPN